MNRLLCTMSGAALLMLVSCGTTINPATQNKVTVLAALDAMNNQNWDALEEYFAADFHRYSQATPDLEVSSLEDMVALVQDWTRAFPDAHMETRFVIAEDDLVAVWVTFAGTHQAPMGPYPATGKRMESETFGFFRLEQGKIKESWVTWDNVAMLTQLGLFPPSSADPPQDTP